MTVPRTLHFIWVGDESLRPDNCIQTWRNHHGGHWNIKIWGNADLKRLAGWKLGRHMRDMATRELNGVADMMRWEILYEEGGIVIDADSKCLKSLDAGDFLEWEAFACWESEIVRPGLIAAGYFGSEPGTPFLRQMIIDINNTYDPKQMAWQSVGPLRLTQAYRHYQYHGLHIYPSHYFIPAHFTGVTYNGRGPVYAEQFWGSTRRGYAELHLRKDI